MEMIERLCHEAMSVAGAFPLNGFQNNSAGSVGCALLSKNGKIYTGLCIDVACSLGFCAEHAAIAEMLKDRQTEIEMIVAVTENGKLIPPCGRCRELMVQVNRANIGTKIILKRDNVVPLQQLLPETWADQYE